MWSLTAAAAATVTTYSEEVEATTTTKTTTATTKQHSSSMRIAPKRVNCISVIYNTFIYAYILIHMPQLIEVLRSVTNGP